MLTELTLENFRGFEKHTIPLRNITVVVGRNNAGKTTIVEALRLVSIITQRYRYLNFRTVPPWLNLPASYRGVSPSVEHMGFEATGIFHRYNRPPAKITATFSTQCRLEIYIGPEYQLHVVILDSLGRPITTKGQTHKVTLPVVDALPAVAPLELDERLLNSEYVEEMMPTTLSPRHFRNQLYIFRKRDPGCYSEFNKIAEETWPSFQIDSLRVGGEPPDASPKLLVRDSDFVGEVGLMGHGLQMWLQIMWFLSRVEPSSIIILDEPDIYMHADLQRKLIRLLRNRYHQVIVATHSVEIMSEVEPEQILIVDRVRGGSKFATSLPAVQRVIDTIGGVHNLQLARLWNSSKCLMVEGNDLSILKRLQDVLFPSSPEPLDTVPHFSIGGWGGWEKAVGSSFLLKSTGGERIMPYCVFDRDYHLAAEIKKRYDAAEEANVQFHVWERKEIENYLLVPQAIHRIIVAECKPSIQAPSLEDLGIQFHRIEEQMKPGIIDAISNELFSFAKKGHHPSNKEARQIVESNWATESGRYSIISGKELIQQLSAWCNNQFGVNLNPEKIAKSLNASEIDTEIAKIIECIDRRRKFPCSPSR